MVVSLGKNTHTFCFSGVFFGADGYLLLKQLYYCVSQGYSNVKNDELSPVFLFSSGRSGSTLLQRYLNTSDDLIIWGEHGGFISGLSRAYYHFLESDNIQKQFNVGRKNTKLLLNHEELVGVDVEWTNNFSSNDWKQAYRKMLLHLFTIDLSSSVRWGFKEIRYGAKEMRFLTELFPQAQMIFLVRHPLDTLASMVAAWLKPSQSWIEGEWVNDTQRLNKFLTQHGTRMLRVSEGMIKKSDNSYLVKYEDLKRAPISTLSPIHDFLDISPPSNERTASLSSDIRSATNKEKITEILRHNFRTHEDVQKVCDMYTLWGYSCSD